MRRNTAFLALMIVIVSLTACAPGNILSLSDTDTLRSEDVSIDRGTIAYPQSVSKGLRLPFSVGEAWYVCQGYKGTISHGLTYSLDLTVDENGIGQNGCWGDVNASAGKAVLAPASGSTLRVGSDLVCLNLDAGGSMLIGHLANRPSSNTRVNQGDTIGQTTRANSTNGDYAHIHVQISLESNCRRGNTVPFSDEFGTRFQNAPDLIDVGGRNQWRATMLKNALTNRVLVQVPGQDEVYWLQNNKRYHVLHSVVIDKMAGISGWSWQQVQPISLTALLEIDRGPDFIFGPALCPFSPALNCSNGVLIRETDTQPVFAMENGKRRWIASEDAFNQRGYRWDDVIEVSNQLVNSIEEGTPIGSGSGSTPPPPGPSPSPSGGGILYGSDAFGFTTISLHQESGRRLYFSGASQWCTQIEGHAFGVSSSGPITGQLSGDKCIMDFNSSTINPQDDHIWFRIGSQAIWVESPEGTRSGDLVVAPNGNVRIPKGSGSTPPPPGPSPSPSGGGILYGSDAFGFATISLHQESGRRLYFSGASQWCTQIEGHAFGVSSSGPITGQLSGDKCIMDFNSSVINSQDDHIWFRIGSQAIWVESPEGTRSGDLVVAPNGNVRMPKG